MTTLSVPALKFSSPRHSAPYWFVLFTLLFWLLTPQATTSSASPLAGSESPKPYALIFGTVWGPGDRPLYGVRIKIRRSNEHKAHWELYSDHQGEFAQRVPAGKADYVVWADMRGFRSLERGLQVGREVHVHIENDERADISLHLSR